MWLLDTTSLVLKEFFDNDIPRYAILSHTWGSSEDEVTFKEMRKHRNIAEMKKGFAKIQNCCLKAVQDGFQYAWIDSCCIDKRSSAELSEAINSMFRYYKRAKVCYAYLADVSCRSSYGHQTAASMATDFASSRWFTRGWTLQELIAPEIVCFYAQDWSFIGAKGHLLLAADKEGIYGYLTDASVTEDFLAKLVSATGVPDDVLQDSDAVSLKSAAQRSLGPPNAIQPEEKMLPTL